jgi:nitroimidazol reductase NimA-like FMN-containing flavoprotein (pyridoxamine 5'-phosphate oxidase superfamily)
MSDTLRTERTTVRRLAARGIYDRDSINTILDEALICHVGFNVDGKPVVIPTIHWRDGDRLYVHGSVASRMLRSLKNGVEACVTVTLLDGLVMARSAFHHSMNYRSVVVYGTAQEVTDRDEKIRALEVLVEHVCRGRGADVRAPNESELRQTIVLSLPIEEASAKVRAAGASDDDEDYALPIWAGVIPMKLVAQPPQSDDRLVDGVAVPHYATNYRR